MAKIIPSISGPSFGGVIYGMNLASSYSNSPSKLTLNIVNEIGSYATPILNSKQSVKFGNFNFNGLVWSYSTIYSSDQKILEVQLVDNSLQLDQKHVILWKRGLLGRNGFASKISKLIDLSDETTLIPVMVGSTFPTLDFKEITLASQNIERTVYSQSPVWIGGALVLGREKWPDSKCDIPDTYYTFDDLRSALPFSSQNAPRNSTLRAGYEGSLREVLSSWCADLGYDFYWDYSRDTLCFYNVEHGISSLPLSAQSPNMISKQVSSSLEGTYKQFAIAYTARPKQPLRELSGSKTIKTARDIPPVNISYFLSRSGKSISLNGNESGKYYGNRTLNEIITAAMIGYVSRPLRDFHCFLKGHFEAIGLKQSKGSFQNIDIKKTIDLLKKIGYADTIEGLEKFDKQGLPGYKSWLSSYNNEFADKLFDLEQDLLSKIGKWYRIPTMSGSFFYCSSKSVAEVEISVDPEGDVQEAESSDFSGRKMFDRGGQMSNDSAFLQEALNLADKIDDIQNCTPLVIDLKESGAHKYLIDAKIISSKSRFNSIVLFPVPEFVASKIGFKSELSVGNNPIEKTWKEIRDARNSSGQKTCPDYESRLADSECTSAKDEAREKARRQLNLDQQSSEDDYVSGLASNTARKCTITLNGGGNVSFFSPSYGSYRVVTTVNVNVKKISQKFDSNQFLFSKGTVGDSGGVSELRIAIDNQTDSGEDFFQQKRTGEITVAQNINASKPTDTVSFKFAGEPQGVNLSPANGLSSLDISLSSDGFTTSVEYRTRSPKPAKNSSVMREVHSQFNRSSFNAN